MKGLVADLRQVRKYKELTATEKLKYRIAVKMTAADYFRLLTRSHEAGVSPSEYMRECFRNGHVKERLSEEHAGCCTGMDVSTACSTMTRREERRIGNWKGSSPDASATSPTTTKGIKT
uniref:plasmid mobilization protein n=1 Tax=Bacteroides stercoris TaxID=46506 RepID=UPI001EFF7EFF|nr:hypothetical protein [Bacteroides stercoris]